MVASIFASQQPAFRGGGWTPADLGAKLLAWWDAEILASLTMSGNIVSSWTDKVAGYVVSASFAGQRPVYTASGFAGRPALAFDGIDDSLLMQAVPFPTGSDGSELWAVVDQQSEETSGAARVALSYGGGGNAGRRLTRGFAFSRAAALAAVGNGAAQVSAIENTVPFIGRHTARAVIEPTLIGVQADSSPLSTVAMVPATGANNTTIGRAQSGETLYWVGLVNSAIITGLLTNEEAAKMSAWGLKRTGA